MVLENHLLASVLRESRGGLRIALVGFGHSQNRHAVVAASSHAVLLLAFRGIAPGGSEPDGGAEERFDTGSIDRDKSDKLGKIKRVRIFSQGQKVSGLWAYCLADCPDSTVVDTSSIFQGEDATEEGCDHDEHTTTKQNADSQLSTSCLSAKCSLGTI